MSTVRNQIAAMMYGRIHTGIASWWGQDTSTDHNMPTLLRAAKGKNFKWALYMESEGQGNPTTAEIASDLTYIRDRYASSPNYLRVRGRFVVFVYANGADDCDMVSRWEQANTVHAYIVLKVFPGYRTCPVQPDSWHQYAPALATTSQPDYSFTISPGFWKVGEAPRLPRSLSHWNQSIRTMIASKAPWQLITTFNEWGEGTAVESGTGWSSPSSEGWYLDALHTNGHASVSHVLSVSVQGRLTAGHQSILVVQVRAPGGQAIAHAVVRMDGTAAGISTFRTQKTGPSGRAVFWNVTPQRYGTVSLQVSANGYPFRALSVPVSHPSKALR
jgi:hypothetical protein